MKQLPADHIRDASPFGFPSVASHNDGISRIAGDFGTRGAPSRADRVPYGELAWTILTDNMWEGHPHRIYRMTTTPWPYWHHAHALFRDLEEAA